MMPLSQKIVFSIANSAAILTALYIAFARDLERPYWAMFTVFIVAKPISGAVRSKGIYRFCGTLVGASMALFLIPPLVQAPLLLCLAMSAWVAFCLYLSLFDRSPRNYAFLLAGYSAAIIGFSVVDNPLEIFDTAVSRVEEISLGIICGALAHSIFFPRSVATVLDEQIAAALKSCGNWIADELDRPKSAVGAANQLSAIIVDLHGLYTHVAFETSDVPRKAPILIALIDRLSVLAPFLSGAEIALEKLRATHTINPSLRAVLKKVASWARAPEGQARGQYAELQADLAAMLVALETQAATARVILETVVVDNIRKLVEALMQARRYAASIADPARDLLPASIARIRVAATRPLHRDPGLALLSAIAAGGATLIACAFWIGLSWPEGAVAAQFAAIGCSLFATLDNPAKVLWQAIIAIIVALPVAAVYEFAILPQATGFESLALALLPMLLLLSFMQTFEKLEGAALVLAIAFAGALALQPNYRADFASFVNSNLAEIAGLMIAIVTNRVFRAIDPAWNALRISRAGWRAVSDLARQSRLDAGSWIVQMFDRLGLVMSRLALLPPGERRPDIDVLRDIRVGINLETLRGTRHHPVVKPAMERVFETAAEVYEAKVQGVQGPEEGAIRNAINHGIATLSAEPPSRSKIFGLSALTSLRLDLVPASKTNAPEAAA